MYQLQNSMTISSSARIPKLTIPFTPLLVYSVPFLPILNYISISYLGVGFTGIYVLLCAIFLAVLATHSRLEIPVSLRYLILFIGFIIVKSLSLGRMPNILDQASVRLVIFALLINNIKIRSSLMKNLRIIGVVGVIASTLVILYQELVDPTFWLPETILLRTDYFMIEGANRRLYSFLAWAGVLSTGTGFAAYLALSLGKQKNRTLVILLIAFAIIYSVLTKQRWIMLGTLFIIIFYLRLKKYRILRLGNLLILASALIIVGLLLNAFKVDYQSIVSERILEQDAPLEQKSAYTRINAFSIFFLTFPDSPIIGALTSSEAYQDAISQYGTSQIHVGYLAIFYHYGIVGGIIFMMFLYTLLKDLVLNAKKYNDWTSVMTISMYYLSNLTLVNYIVFDMGFAVALIYNQYLKTDAQTALIGNNNRVSA